MTSDGSDGPKTSIDVSVGKEIDAALGDVIRGLLQKPSEAVGDLVADGIGILGDRVRRKRELNAKLGMEEVRKRLDADGVDMKDITPPKEEELHLLMNGMSLADDGKVRDMWAGLFARALEPGSDVTAERQFITILNSLSATDAKIVDLLVFIQKTEAELQQAAKQFNGNIFGKMTEEQREEIQKIQEENNKLQETAVAKIRAKAIEYGIASFETPGWSDNLMRQGVIERTKFHHFGHSSITLRSMDEREMLQTITEMGKRLEKMQEVAERNATPPLQVFTPHMWAGRLNPEIELTSFGERFAAACGIK